DEAGGTTRHPLHKDWPLEMLSVFSFEDEAGGKTKFTASWQPHKATPTERQNLEAGRSIIGPSSRASTAPRRPHLATKRRAPRRLNEGDNRCSGWLSATSTLKRQCHPLSSCSRKVPTPGEHDG